VHVKAGEPSAAQLEVVAGQTVVWIVDDEKDVKVVSTR
jgi:hypothetical protein